MRAASVAAASSVLAAGLLFSTSCAPTYEDMIAAGDEVICPAEGLCPAPQVCIRFDNEPRCKPDFSCSLMKQDCLSLYGTRSDYAVRRRCTLVQTGDGRAGPECVQTVGSSPEGSACTVLVIATAGFGNRFASEDIDCAPGLICHNPTMSDLPVLPGVCRRFCKADTDCLLARCIDAFGPAVTTEAVSTPEGPVGVCMASCTLLSAAGKPTGCESQPGTVCQPVLKVPQAAGAPQAFGICRKPGDPGTSDDGRSCSEAFPCPTGFGCLPGANGYTCHKLCKAAQVACPTNQTCNTTDYQLSDGAGVCK